MNKSLPDSVALVLILLAAFSALAWSRGGLGWFGAIGGLTLLVILFSYDSDASRTLFQSLAFAAVGGLAVTAVATLFFRKLLDNGEVHMTDGRIETVWMPLSWVCGTLALWAIDRIRMSTPAASRLGAVQRGFIPQYAAPEPASAPEPRPVVPDTPPETPRPPIAIAQTPTVPVPVPLPPKEVEIYVSLVGEGLNLMRTVRAEHLGRDFYRILEPMPAGENWEFQTGQVVRCKSRKLSTGKGLVAVEEAPRAS